MNGLLAVERNVKQTTKPPLAAIFHCFFTIGSQSFGGGTSAWIRREVVDKRSWLTDQQFLSCLSVCQIAPGPNPMNMAVFLGSMLRGTAGALTAFAGLMIFPVILCLSLGAIYFSSSHLPGVATLLGGLGAVAIGMNISNGIRLTRKNIRKIRHAVMIIIVTTAVGFFHLPLFDVLFVVIPVSILVELRFAA